MPQMEAPHAGSAKTVRLPTRGNLIYALSAAPEGKTHLSGMDSCSMMDCSCASEALVMLAPMSTCGDPRRHSVSMGLDNIQHNHQVLLGGQAHPAAVCQVASDAQAHSAPAAIGMHSCGLLRDHR